MKVKSERSVKRTGLDISFESLFVFCSALIFLGYFSYIGLRLCTPIDVPHFFPIAIDFAVFWSAGKLTLSGMAGEAYNVEAINRILVTIIDHNPESLALPWFYPPPALLWFIPFALLSYKYAVVLWQGIGVATYLYGIGKVNGRTVSAILLLGFPGFWMNLLWGNHAYVITALIALGYYNLRPRPIIAGGLFGLLCYKPHLAAVCLLTLLAAGRWKALFSAALTILALIATSFFLFPVAAWQGYIASMPRAVDYLLLSGWENYPDIHVTVYTFMKLLGVTSGTAFVIQGLSAATVALVLAYFWNKAAFGNLTVAAVVPAILLATPYALQYDLALLGLPLCIYFEEVSRNGWLFSGEKTLFFLCWLLPLYNWPLAHFTLVQPAPVIVAAFLCAIVLRARIVHAFEQKPVASYYQHVLK